MLAMVQKLNSDQLGNILSYELPLSRSVTEFDVYTDRYEIVILRVLLQEPGNSSEVQAAASARQVIADQLRADLTSATALLDKAIRDQVRNAKKAGCSWTEIGHALGTSKQAAWERFSRDE